MNQLLLDVCRVLAALFGLANIVLAALCVRRYAHIMRHERTVFRWPSLAIFNGAYVGMSFYLMWDMLSRYGEPISWRLPLGMLLLLAGITGCWMRLANAVSHERAKLWHDIANKKAADELQAAIDKRLTGIDANTKVIAEKTAVLTGETKQKQ